MSLNKIKSLLATRESDAKRMIEDIKFIHSSFYEKHNRILELMSLNDDFDFDSQDEIGAAFDAHYYHCRSIFTSLFTKAPTTSIQDKSISHIKLPQLELMTFSGDVKQYKSFIDMFKEIIHNNNWSDSTVSIS